MTPEPIEVTALTVYPVKAMKGIQVDSALLRPAGLDCDRRFMVVRDNGRFVTQRDLPRLALVRTALEEGVVRLSMEGRGEVTLPPDGAAGKRIATKVWGDPCEATDLGEEISLWLTSALESESRLRLVRMAPGFVRPQSRPEHLGEHTHTHFADSAPLLVAVESSLARLNNELRARGMNPVPMNRFRPNIVVSGLDAFAEHRTSGLESDGYALKFCHPCERCVVTTIDQSTAHKDPDWQPFKTLRDINPVPGKKPAAPAFGQNAVLVRGSGQRITLGDRLSVLS